MAPVKRRRDFNKQSIVSKSACHVKTKGYLVLSVAGTISFGADAGTSVGAPALFGAGICAGASTAGAGAGADGADFPDDSPAFGDSAGGESGLPSAAAVPFTCLSSDSLTSEAISSNNLP